MAELLLSDLT